jgi:hypothetical protein
MQVIHGKGGKLKSFSFEQHKIANNVYWSKVLTIATKLEV